MKKSILTFLILIFSISLISPAVADEFNFKDNSCDCSCFRGKPLSECKAYWVVETGFMTRVKEKDFADEYQNMFIANFGRMFNLTKKSALGGTFSFVSDGDGVTIGLGPNYRYWLSKRMGIDVSPHLIFANTGNYKTGGYGYQINASIAIGELFSVNGHYRNVSYKPGGDVLAPGNEPLPLGGYQRPAEKGFYFGMSGRSYAAPVAPAIVLILHLLFKDIGFDNSSPFY